MNKDKLGIYIHIPFCVSKCNYCDFYSIKWDESTERKFIKCALEEIKMYNALNKRYSVDTIYIGGGTPSIIKDKNIYKIINEIYKSFDIDDDLELSIEANPNSLTKEKLKNYRQFKINRVSIGIQSLDNKILKTIGRIHNCEEAVRAIKMTQDAGFENMNTDIMFNISGQTISNVLLTIKEIIKLEVPHISFYSLKVEKNTPFFNMINNNELNMPDESLEREMYYMGRKEMESNNIYQYEISNFSRKGFECKHNLRYWTHKPYIGIGPAAHSYIEDTRFNNVDNINKYFDYIKSNKKAIVNRKTIDNKEKMFEYLILRLRLTKGFSSNDFYRTFKINFLDAYKDIIEELETFKLIKISKDNIRLTKKGIDVSNYVFTKFLI